MLLHEPHCCAKIVEMCSARNVTLTCRSLACDRAAKLDPCVSRWAVPLTPWQTGVAGHAEPGGIDRATALDRLVLSPRDCQAKEADADLP